MAVLDMAYVELFTKDEAPAVDYFVRAMGFTPVARCDETDRSSVLLEQGEAQLIVTTGPGVQGFLDAHGDGVADVVFTCDDVAATVESAAAAGAALIGTRNGDPVVSGFGDVRHTLLPASQGVATPLPAGRHWVPTPAPAPGPHQRVQILDHIAVCLEGGTLQEYADKYRDAFGFARYSSEYIAVGAQAMDSIVIRNETGRVTFTLVASDPAKDRGQLDAFLERNGGPGVQHLAFLVDDVVAEVHDLRSRGVDFLSTPDSYYDMLGERIEEMSERIAALRAAQVLADRDEWGYLLQVFSRSPYDRNTLFFEFIQRQGSRGFGSANIRALYEAVERDRLSLG